MILLQCGIAAMLFGVAYGSVFGVEHWLPALWFRPMEDLPRLLRIGGCVGLAMVSLSFALGVLNAALRRDWSEAVFGAHGLLAAVTYWTAAALALRWLVAGEVGVAIGQVTMLLAVPLALLGAWHVAAELRRPGGAGSSPVAAFLSAGIELLDFGIRSIGNTVSFVRVSAFAVSHAGLLVAVFALGDALAASRAGGVAQLLVLVLGNALVIALEGLVVSIQGVRLVYYEFFSRFHEGTGLLYRPLALRASRGEEGVR
jgi:V/A-type H+-transporting ATPase subunit I